MFSLNYHSSNPDLCTNEHYFEVARRLAEITGLHTEAGMNYLQDHMYDPFSFLEDDMKWYDHDEHMIQLSLEFPDMWFELWGSGEDRDDNWRAVYHNGKSNYSRAELVYDEYKHGVFEDEEDMPFMWVW